jgi:hypothetical protein
MTLALLSALPQEYPEYAEPGAGAAIFGGVFMIVYLALIVLTIAGIWKVFTKAGEPGWAAIIPIYNIIVLVKIAGRPLWWFILLLIPIVGLIVAIIVSIDVAKRFGKGAGYGLGLAILPFIFYPLLGFGSATYQGGRA